MLIACSDNLGGTSEAIVAVFPKCEHQLCIVHQIRNSMQYVSYKHRKEVANDLKPIYKASTEDEAMLGLEVFDKKWSSIYPQIAKSWYNNWVNLIVFLQYPQEIRKIIYTTNAIGTPGKAWLNKKVKFLPREDLTNRLESSFAPSMVTCYVKCKQSEYRPKRK